jgi:cytochrome c553
MKKYFILSLFILLTFNACSDKKDEKSMQSVEKNISQQAGKIEVVENDNFKEEKVQVKKDDSNESKNFYYDYHQETKAHAQAEEESNYTPLGAMLKARSPYEHVEVGLLVNQLSKNFIVKCSACHNHYANGIIGPSLLSKDSAYIFKTISQYRTGEKKNVLMKELIEQMDDKEIKALADEIYTFNQEVKKIKERQK